MHPCTRMAGYTGSTSRTRPYVNSTLEYRSQTALRSGPDDDIYVSATQDGCIYKFNWSHDGRVSERTVFGNVLDPTKSGFRGGDGIAFGRDRLLYATVSRQGTWRL